MTIETWLTFCLASLILTMTPGPSILLGVVHSMKYGVNKAIFTALGDISANFIQMIIVAVGLGIIMSTSELAFAVIKWLGVTTLLYMGIKMLRDKPECDAQITTNSPTAISGHRLYLSGFFVAAGNPKAIVFFTAFFPQFIDPTKPLLSQMLVMCPTMAVLDFTWVMIYAISAKKLLGFMQDHPTYLNKIGGSALLTAAIALAVTSHSSNL